VLKGNGNVGIGTTTPGSVLTVQGAGPQLELRTNSNGFGYTFGRSVSTGYLEIKGNQVNATGFTFGTVSSAQVTIDTNGVVAIGAAPAAQTTRKLQLDGTDIYMGYNTSGTEKWVVGKEDSQSTRFVWHYVPDGAYRMTLSTGGKRLAREE